MHSNYKRLGEFIVEKNELNTGNKIGLLLGVSNGKYFQKAKTNTIGIDLSKYRVVHHNQFVFNRATTRNGDKISIALRNGESCIVSPSYRVFEIKDENVLLSEYVMMWFRRPEFDRYARFKSHGSAHEFFDMEEMCDVEIPVPSIEKQRELVAEYHAVEQRIKLNENLCQKLEETAQTLYRHWFEDFEFPVESQELKTNNQQPTTNNQTYKSSGGKMVYNEELGKEIPEGWSVGKLGDVFDTIGGGTPSTEIEEYWNGDIIWYSPTDVTKNKSIYSDNSEKKITELGMKKSSAKILPRGSLLMTSRATIGAMIINEKPATTNQGFISILPTSAYNAEFLYHWVQARQSDILSKASGSTFLEISKSEFRSFDFLKPSAETLLYFERINLEIFKQIKIKNKQTQKLEELKSLLLGKMAVE